MKRTAIATLALVSMFALQGCAAEGSAPVEDDAAQSQEHTSEQLTESQPKTDDTTEAAEAEETAEAPADFFTVEYEDSYKSIFTLDQAQIEAATGVKLSDDTRAQAAEKLANTELRKQNTQSADYADLIVEAYQRESDSTDHALRAVLDNPTARMKVYVAHTPHKTIAHIQIDNDN